MKLTYRGAEYDYNPPMLEVTESEIVCQYRTQPTHYTYVRHVPIPQAAERLAYRGVSYQTSRKGEVLSENSALSSSSSIASKFRTLRHKLMGNSSASQARRKLLKESSQLHRESMVRSLQHRLEVAQQQGNDQLIQQLEAEMRQSSGVR
ncbi:MAG: DUF4278 domain-containing protein [Cyanobacteria bacterium P01_D01_bin.105]